MQVLLIAFLLALLSAQAPCQMEKEQSTQLRGVNATDAQIVTGLREGLALSALTAIKTTGAENGFWGDDSIKIIIPGPMKALEAGLRRAGNGLKIGEFELSLNRAAELSAGGSSQIFAKAIGGLNFSDPRAVLNGSNTAATNYLSRNAAAELLQALRPLVEAAMNRTGVLQNYNTLFIQIKGLTMGEAAPIDVSDYLVRRTLDGLLYKVAQEELKIRSDPQGQTAPILREVFGKR